MANYPVGLWPVEEEVLDTRDAVEESPTYGELDVEDVIVWVQSSQALPFSEGHGHDPVVASTCKELELDEEVEDGALVQSSQALPFSEGQAELVGLWVTEVVLGLVTAVVVGSTSKLDADAEVDDDTRVQSNQALPLSDGHAKLVGRMPSEVVELVELVIAGFESSKLDTVEEVEDASRVQSSQALPFSEGQAKLVGLYTMEEVEVAATEEVVVISCIKTELVVDDEVKLQSNHALPFSDGQTDQANFVVREEVGRDVDVVSASSGTEFKVEDVVVATLTGLEG
ncbi:hypothetical protein A1O7_04571 [Cladophialophora yegresii CBS 114405]|uniref:Uncharacterized protein n=1 Tax=Cladophialophora yegresii CBS 114405 TaxID=1182544 RepID=W9WPW8_9EURO|nr:uncharacterized protein A1O7_04571 [Cladophialophora yegresii CBS 114405]EXJ60419.1 hypothetical protein A1O7_04571 [Cladophialophora yegresii CBS 114405]